MPMMVRPPGKGKKVAFSILGTPPNYTDNKTEKQKKIDERIASEESMRTK
jgi:hypothetical protein